MFLFFSTEITKKEAIHEMAKIGYFSTMRFFIFAYR